MSKIEIPAGTNPEILKPYRYKTDWGTRLFFHPELFGGATGKHFDIIDENGSLHENVFCEDGEFTHTALQKHPKFLAWSPTALILHGYEQEEFIKHCVACIKTQSDSDKKELTEALTAFYEYRKKASRTELLNALAGIQDRTLEEDLLYRNLQDLKKYKITPSVDVNDIFRRIIDAFKTILVGNVYSFNKGKFLYISDVKGRWTNEGDAKIYAECDEISLDKCFMPYKRSAEETVVSSLCYTAKHVVENNCNPLASYTYTVDKKQMLSALEANKTEYKTVCENVSKIIDRFYAV